MRRLLKFLSRQRWRILGVLGLSFVAAIIAGFTWSEEFLIVEQPPVKADAIVLLGGGGDTRPPRALELFQAGLAPIILISGDGDADQRRFWMEARGVPAAAIKWETNSVSTWQNAKFSAPILHQLGVKRVLLVTSWFHSRRALASFRKVAPDIEFISVPTIGDRPSVDKTEHVRHERATVLYEYLKLPGYFLFHGVNSF